MERDSEACAHCSHRSRPQKPAAGRRDSNPQPPVVVITHPVPRLENEDPIYLFSKLYICLYQALIVALRIFSCRMWDPVPLPGMEPGPPALGARSPSHRTPREVLRTLFIHMSHFSILHRSSSVLHPNIVFTFQEHFLGP